MKRIISRVLVTRAGASRNSKAPASPTRSRAPARHLQWMGRLTRRLPYNLDLILPSVVLLGVALALATLALGKAGELSDAGLLPAGRGGGAIKVQRLYLDRGEYQEYSPTLARLNPGVNVTAGADGALMLAIVNEELFPDLMMALHTLQSFKPGVAWEMVEFCVRTCPEKAVARVVVKGFKQELR